MAEVTGNRKKKILIIKDKERTPKPLRFFFEEEGYEVIEAGDEIKALEKIEQLAPDLIILGEMMPRTEKSKVLEKLQADLQTEKIPVIFIHAQEDIADEDRIVCSCWGHISESSDPPKPFDPREGVVFVKRILQALADDNPKRTEE